MQPDQQQRIMGYFIEEAKDHLNTIEQGLVNLQGTIRDPEMANEVFRAAHSVKGGAAMLGLNSIQQVAHRLEDFFKLLKDIPVNVDQKLETLFLAVFDALQALIGQLQGPFGLTEDSANTILAGVEPTFEELEQHLTQLAAESAGSKPPTPVATGSDLSFSSTFIQLEGSVEQIFRSDIPAQLREMLQLFKQSDANPNIRQQLQEICRNISRIGEQYGLSNWCYLIETARRAIAHPDNSYRTLAPIVIKDIKLAQELVLAGCSDEISPCTQLQELAPTIQAVAPSQQPDNLADLFTEINADDFTLDQPLAASTDLSTDLSFEGLEPVTSGNLDFGAAFAEQPHATDEFLGQHGPEVGMAELNTLADLFEGEVPDLGLTWQEEEVLGDRAESASLVDNLQNLDASSDFSDLLFEEVSLEEATTESATGDDLNDLFGDGSLNDEDRSNLNVIDESPSLEEIMGADGFELDDDDFDDLLAISESNQSNELTGDEAIANQDAADFDNVFAEFDFDNELRDLAGPTEFEENFTFIQPEAAGSPGERLEEQSESEFTPSPAQESFAPPVDSGIPDPWSEPNQNAASLELSSSPELEELPLDTYSSGEPFEELPSLDELNLDDLIDPATASEDIPVAAESADPFMLISTPPAQPAAVPDPWGESEERSDAPSWADFPVPEEIPDLPSLGDLSLESLDTPEVWDEPGTPSADAPNLDLEDFDFSETFDLSETQDSSSIDSQPDQDIGNLLSDDSHEELDDLFGTPASEVFSTRLEIEITSETLDLSSEPTASTSPGFEGLEDLFGETAEPDGSSIDLLDFLELNASPAAELESAELFDLGDDLLELNSGSEPLDEQLFGGEDEIAIADNLTDLDHLLADQPSSEPADNLTELDDLLADEPALPFARQEGLADFADLSTSKLDSATADLLFDAGDFSSNESALADDSFDNLNSLLSDEAASTETGGVLGLGDSSNGESALADDSFDDLDSLLEGEPPPVAEGLADLESLLNEEFSSTSGFGDLKNLLSEDIDTELAASSAATFYEDTSTEPIENEAVLRDNFSSLEALLDEGEIAAIDAAPIDTTLTDAPLTDVVTQPSSSSTIPAASLTVDTEFDDLDDLLKETEEKMGGSPSIAVGRGIVPQARRTTRPGRVFSEQTMRVPVKHLDNLSNLVGELVVNRNSLEQDQERLRQSLDNLLYQVQQLSDVGQRMQDLYERSLLESSLLASRHNYRLGAIQASVRETTATETESSISIEYDPLEMDRFTGFHSLSQEMIELIVRVRESSSDIEFIVDETEQVTRMFRQVTTQLQEGLTRSRMVPFAQTADRLPRAVRDISLRVGKQADLIVEGRETLIDKMILEQLYDPMTHLVNNAITHGIESPEVRMAAGKPPAGRMVIRAFHQGNQTIISISDDGAGINVEQVKAKAVEKGLLTSVEANSMSRLDVYDILFHPGFTTKDQADNFSGRGIGMDVVRTSLSEIRGAISTDSTPGKGTTFTIRLPLTLSISKALCCISDRARIAFPMDGVEDMLDIPRDRIQTNPEGQPCITWRDTMLLVRPLSELLSYNRHLSRGNVYGGNQEDDIISVVVLRSAGNFLALQVDQVLGEQEIVIKQLEGPVPKPVGVAGATVLGDGRIMPIADVLELIDLSMGRIRRDASSSLWEHRGDQVIQEPPATKTEPMVLIVDDSITVRELLSMTFNKVGYRVEQARDGQEAWEKLRSGLPCDIVFCDIEMPRMDGLEFLSRIQKDPHLKHLPIAMLTSRGADRHRQMAASLGASGYFTKPYLEEALLDAAQRMLKGDRLLSNH
ncbi:MAG: response regulator [Leptolyngbyaceae cyanobacterium RU_5_1]|nr:response regulator [Leptolyngbyaceae cyanobacterium RU_5_1]